ncbi:MAG: LytTR family DNA-binding domain-containing protein [Telluria sp.]|jgi:DNA-binding LytR/AlgR family response regulator
MKTMTAILAEDEPVLRDELREALAALWPELKILAETGDGVSTLRAIQAQKPDVVFLDINMPQLNGLEVAKAVRDTTTVVFLTAYNEHALEAFELGAVDYLVKPLQRGRLLTTIGRLQARAVSERKAVPDAVFDLIAARPERKFLRWIQASVGASLRLITIDEVHYFQSDAKYTRVVTGHSEALIRRPIKELVDELNPDDFLQVSRGAIVNLRRIESIYRDDGHMEIRLKDSGTRLAVSVGFQAAFRQM